MTGALQQHQEIHQDDFGRWRVGLADDGTGFESRAFAMSVAGYPPLDDPVTPSRRRAFFNIKTAKEARFVARLSA